MYSHLSLIHICLNISNSITNTVDTRISTRSNCLGGAAALCDRKAVGIQFLPSTAGRKQKRNAVITTKRKKKTKQRERQNYSGIDRLNNIAARSRATGIGRWTDRNVCRIGSHRHHHMSRQSPSPFIVVGRSNYGRYWAGQLRIVDK